MLSPEQIVRDFLATLEARDIDGLVSKCTEDIVYANVPVPPHRGRAAVREFLSFNFKKCSEAESTIHNIAVTKDGGCVLTERTEALIFGDKRVQATFMGIFEIRDGLISAWRDYWDMASFAKDMKAAGQMAGPGIGEMFA
jgi:limonene-1,2-epoxide hydrolase